LEKTIQQYNGEIALCKDIFMKKTIDYGTAWRILRPSSITDQLFIKARRIRSIEEKGSQRVADSIQDEYRGLVNYSILAIVQLEMSADAPLEIEPAEVEKMYDQEVGLTRDLMVEKNSDYGEVWREMRVSSITDLILQKLYRIKQIEDHEGKTIISEGLDANYRDIINYSIFSLIKMSEEK
jgi:hypothetical protein